MNLRLENMAETRRSSACSLHGRGLAGKQFSMADEVGSKHLVQRVQVRLNSCLEETADQSLVLFGL